MTGDLSWCVCDPGKRKANTKDALENLAFEESLSYTNQLTAVLTSGSHLKRVSSTDRWLDNWESGSPFESGCLVTYPPIRELFQYRMMHLQIELMHHSW